MRLPRLYPIADVGALAARGIALESFVQGLLAGGAEIVQLRDKQSGPEAVLRHAAVITEQIVGSPCLPVMNDRADLAVLAGWRAVHVGHRDLPPDAVRAVLGAVAGAMGGEPGDGPVVVGVSTHNDAQVAAAEGSSADYVAVGPVFRTGTKADAEPVVGLEGLRRMRALTGKPLVAIGGITRENAAEVIAAGADSVAVIGGLLEGDQRVEETVRDFLRRLR